MNPHARRAIALFAFLLVSPFAVAALEASNVPKPWNGAVLVSLVILITSSTLGLVFSVIEWWL